MVLFTEIPALCCHGVGRVQCVPYCINLGAGDMGDPAQRAAAGRGGLRAPLCHVLPARALGHMEAGGLGLEPCRLGESGE